MSKKTSFSIMAIMNKILIFMFLTFVNQISGTRIPSLLEPKNEGKLFAVLVAGSDGWYNYRHQVSIIESAFKLIYIYEYPKVILLLTLKLLSNKVSVKINKILS